jgi:hypothetical protein
VVGRWILTTMWDFRRQQGVFLRDGITNHALEEALEHAAGLLVDHGRDTLDTATAGETADGGLGDTWGEMSTCRRQQASHIPWMLSRKILR